MQNRDGRKSGQDVIDKVMTDTEQTMTHVVGRVNWFREANEDLMNQNEQLQERLEEVMQQLETEQAETKKRQKKVRRTDSVII